VSGVGSQWNNSGSVSVGYGGQGTLIVQNGGVASSGADTNIGFQTGSAGTATVTDSGSQLNVGGTLFVGNAGQGTLTIQNGGVVSTASGNVGFSSGSSGTVLVTGAGSAWNNANNLSVGINGNGTLTVENGGLVTAGTLANPGTITIGTLGTMDAKGGTLQGNIIDDGTLDPLGAANILGNLTVNPDGTVVLDVAGTQFGQLGQLDITGSGTFDGLLNIDFINGFAPQMGQTFDLINLTGNGDFSSQTTEITGLLPGFDYSVDFANGTFDLTALNNGVSSATPEPNAWLLLGTALLGASLLWSRSKRAGGQV
jgi:T5SS/PEP-CTERM-associated repeat protein